MSDQTITIETGTPAATKAPTEPATTAHTATAPAAAPTAASSTEDPKWLPERLEQARRAAVADVLKGLGVDKPEALKAQLDKLKALEESQLSDAEKVAKRIADLEPRAKRADQLEGAVKVYADREFGSLNEQQRDAVTAIAGDDPANILKTIESLRPTWFQQTTAPAAVAAPASTSAAPPPPAAAGGVSETDHKSRFEQLKKENPFAASRYFQANKAALLK